MSDVHDAKEAFDEYHRKNKISPEEGWFERASSELVEELLKCDLNGGAIYTKKFNVEWFLESICFGDMHASERDEEHNPEALVSKITCETNRSMYLFVSISSFNFWKDIRTELIGDFKCLNLAGYFLKIGAFNTIDYKFSEIIGQ